MPTQEKSKMDQWIKFFSGPVDSFVYRQALKDRDNASHHIEGNRDDARILPKSPSASTRSAHGPGNWVFRLSGSSHTTSSEVPTLLIDNGRLVLPEGIIGIPRPRILSRQEAENKLNGYLISNPKTRANMFWCFGQDGWSDKNHLDDPNHWKSYDQLPSAFKQEFREKFIAHAIFPGLRMVSVNTTKTEYSVNELKEVYLAYIAHSLVVDSFHLVPWRLKDFTDEHLRWLLDARYYGFSIAVEIDRCNETNADQLFQFGFVERRNTALGPNDFYPIATPALPGDPALLFAKGFHGIGVKNSNSMTEAVSLLSRWCQDNLVHGDTRHSWGGGVFTNSNWIKTLYPSIEVMFLGQMESQYINPFKQLLNTRYINPLLPHPLTAGDLVNSKGVFADPAMGENDGSGTINFPQTIGFVKHCTYAGCQSTGGMLHWILKAINIPSKMYSGFMGDVSGNFPGAMHKGIEVFTGQSETMVVGHADHFYQGMSVYYSAIASQSFTAHYLDPHKDLIDIFAPKSLIEWWLPPYNGTQAGSDPNYNSAQRELYYSFMIMTGAIRQFSTYVVEWWKEYERVSRVEGNMDLDRILWVKYLKGLKGPSTGFVDRALPFVFSRIKDRISDIEQNINTQWGKKLSDYEAGMKAWHLTHYANKTDYTLWRHP